MEKLHPGAKWIFFIQYFFIFLPIILVITSYISVRVIESASAIITYFILILVIVLFIAIVWSILTYNNWGYEFRKEGLYIKRGVIWKHYSSVPYERIQNIDVCRGILARIFGFSGLAIQTAGYHAAKGTGAEGSLPAVEQDKAEKYREWLLKRIGRRQGL